MRQRPIQSELGSGKASAEVDQEDAKIRASENAIGARAAKLVELDRAVAEPWALLCQHALGGREPEDAETVRVRTSAANRAAWGGGDDRALEKPQQWNDDMRREAQESDAGLRRLEAGASP